MDLTPPQDTLLLVCTYTNNDILAHLPKGELGRGVYSLRLDARTGALTPLSASDVAPFHAPPFSRSTSQVRLLQPTVPARMDSEARLLDAGQGDADAAVQAHRGVSQ